MTKELEKKIDDLVDSYDDKIRIKDYIPGLAGTAIEAVDGPVFKTAIKFGVNKLSDLEQAGFETVVDALIKKDYEVLIAGGVDNLVDMLKTPLGDAREAIILNGLSKTFFDLVKYEIKNSTNGQKDSVGGGSPGGNPGGGGG